MFQLERIQKLGERFAACGDYLQGLARIRCANLECGHVWFRPFSCKGFYLCPSCSRKRTLLFADVFRVINKLFRDFYNDAACRTLFSGMLIVHQAFGDMFRWNPHFHAIVLEGGFDNEGTFFKSRLILSSRWWKFSDAGG